MQADPCWRDDPLLLQCCKRRVAPASPGRTQSCPDAGSALAPPGLAPGTGCCACSPPEHGRCAQVRHRAPLPSSHTSRLPAGRVWPHPPAWVAHVIAGPCTDIGCQIDAQASLSLPNSLISMRSCICWYGSQPLHTRISHMGTIRSTCHRSRTKVTPASTICLSSQCTSIHCLVSSDVVAAVLVH